MSTDLPPGQPPINPQGAFAPPPPPPGGGGYRPAPPPPPQMMAPPPQYWGRPRRSFAGAIFTTLATAILGFSILLNIYLIFASGLFSGGGNLRMQTIQDGDSAQKIMVIPISGTIMEEASQKFEKRMQQVEKDGNVKAIVLEVDTPGGGVTASDEIFHRISRYKKEHGNVPVVVAQGGLATSGGYYVSCAGDYIFAEPTTLTGNIGVLMPRFNLSKLMDKWGVEETTIASTGATFKNAGSMFKPENPVDTAYIQGLADSAFATFKKVVKDGRGSKLTDKIDIIANGKVYTAYEAAKLGLVDQIGYSRDAYDWVTSKAGLKNPEIVRFQDTSSLFDIFGGKSNQSQGVAINGINVNADVHSIYDLMAPRMMYLWRGE